MSIIAELEEIVEIFEVIIESITLLLMPLAIANAIGLKKEVPPAPEEIWYEITIDNSANSNDLTDYQVLLTITGDAQFFSDCSNDDKVIEIYDEDKATLIPFYVEEWDAINKNARIWIKVPLIPANSIKKVYLKVNPDRTESLSNPDNVFDFYDDFSDNDVNGWTPTISTDVSEHDDILDITLTANIGGEGGVYNNLSVLNDGIEIVAKMKLVNDLSAYTGLGVFFRYQDIDNFFVFQWTETPEYRLRKKVAGTFTDFVNLTDQGAPQVDVWYIIHVKVYSDGTIKAYVEGKAEISATDTTFTSGYIGIHIRNTSGQKGYVDWIYVRKITEPEPTVTYNKL